MINIRMTLKTFDTLLWNNPAHNVSYVSDYNHPDLQIYNLYLKGEEGQWKASDLNWDSQFDPENPLNINVNTLPIYGTSLWEEMSDAARNEYGWHFQNASLSNILHGESAGSIVLSKLVTVLPTNDQRFFAATQLVDEYRHTSIVSRIIDNRFLGDIYPIRQPTINLCQSVLNDNRWDIIILCISVLEFCGAVQFRNLGAITNDPFSKHAFEKMLLDESRHVAFSNVVLIDFYKSLTYSELKVREEAIFETLNHLDELTSHDEIRVRLGISKEKFNNAFDPARQRRKNAIFNYVGKWLKNIGFYTDNIRDKFIEMGINE